MWPNRAYTLQTFGLVIALCLASAAFASDVLWTNSVGGNWSTAASWNTGTVPGPSDSVFLTNSGSYTVTLDVDATVASLTVGGTSGAQTLSVSSHTITINTASAILANGVLKLINSTAAGVGILTNQGTLNTDNSAINASLVNQGFLVFRGFGDNLGGSFENQAGATLRVMGDGSFSGAQLTLAQGFTNYGLIELTSVVNPQPATLVVTSGTLINAAGAQINVLAGTGNAGRTLTAQLDNQGTLNVATSLLINKASAAHLNSGSIILTNGDLTVSQSGTPATFTTTGTIDIATNLTFTISGGILNYNSGTISGPGTVSLSSSTANFVPDFSNASTGLLLASATFNGPGRLTNAPGKTLNTDNSTINASLVNQGFLVFRGFGDNLGGSFENQAGATLRVMGDGSFSGAQLTLAQGFTNYGLIELTSVVNPQPATLVVTSGTLINAAGAQINVLAGTGNAGRTLTAQLDNQGTLNVATSLLINKASAAHLNSGSIILTNGDLTVSQSGTPATFTTTGTIDIATNLTFTISGGILNYNSGTISGPGTVSLSSSTANFVPDFSNASTGLLLASATFNGPGRLTNAPGKTLNTDNSTINASLVNQGFLVFRGFGDNLGGSFENQAGATLRVMGDGSFSGAQLTLAQGFTNYGLIELTSVVNPQPATLVVTSGTLINAAGAQINVLAGTGNAGRTLTAQLDNQGTLNVATSLLINKASAAHLNSGSIILTNGDLTVSQSGTPATFTTTGTIDIATNLTFTISGGILNYNSGTISGPGTVSLSSSTANFVPDFSNASTGLLLASATFNGPGRLTNAPGKTLNTDNSTINASLVNQGFLVFRGFGDNLGGSFENQAGATLRVMGDGSFSGAQLTLAQGFTNYGLIELTSVVNPQPATLVVTSGTLINAAGAQINVLAGTGNAGRTLTAQLDNQGTLNVATSLLINKASAAHLNSGSIILTNGDLTVSQSGTPATFTTTGTIDIATNLTFTISGGILNYNSGTISGPGTVSLSSSTANFVPDFSNASTGLLLASATFNGPGRLTNAPGKTLNTDNSTINASLVNQGFLVFRGFGDNLGGSFENQAGATLRVMGDGSFSGAQLTLAQGFTNYGLIELTSVVNPQPATLVVTSGTLINAAGAQINVLAGTGNAGRTLTAQLDNQGTLNVATSLLINKASAAHLNSGSIILTNGDLTVSQSGTPATFTTTGTIDIATNLTFTISGGILNYNSGTISGPGTVSLSSSTANFVPDFSNASTGLLLASATFNGPGRLTNAPGKTLNTDNSTINASLVNQGFLVFRGFGDNLGGSFENQAGATLRVMGDGSFSGAQLTLAQGFTNYGLIELTSVVNPQPATLVVTSGTLINAAGAQINVLAGTGNAGRTLTAQLDNQGTLNVATSLLINKASAAHLDEGTINVSDGQTLQINGGTFQVNPQGVLQGSGNVDVSSTSFTNSGSVKPGAALGRLSVVGSFPQTSSGAVNVEIGGRSPGLDYDQLQISGSATLAGTLNIGLTNGFRPSGGDSFEVLRFGSRIRAFDHINGLDLGGGLFLLPVFSPTNMVLTTIDTRPQIVFETPRVLSGGAVEIILDGTAGRDFVIETSTNLASGIWTPIVTSTNSGAIFDLILTDVTNFPARFFRFKQ